MLKYLKKYKDISFEKAPLNKLDIALMTGLIYLNFDKDETLAEFFQRNKDKKANEFKTVGTFFNEKIIDVLRKSTRWKQIKISNIVNLYDEQKPLQFFALTMTICDQTFIIFRGTDDYLMSWKENFYLSFQDKIPSNDEALRYTEQILKKYDKVIICGHSKGGNDALYVASILKSSQIKELYIYDSPGFLDEKIIDTKINFYAPKNSVVSMILKMDNIKIKYVKTNHPPFISHTMRTWNVDMNKLDFERSKITSFSKNIDYFNKLWINKTTKSERKKLTETFFKNIKGFEDGKIGGKTLLEYLSFIYENFKNAKNIDEQEKTFLKDSYVMLTSLFKEAFKKD